MTDVVVLLVSVPTPFKFQVTPSELLSLATVADNVIESAPSTDEDGTEIDTLVGPEPLEPPEPLELPGLLTLPPHPDRQKAATRTIPIRT